MPKKRNTRGRRSPTKEEQGRIFFTGYQLDELFFPEEIEDFMDAAKRRIIRRFYNATEPNPRYRWGSDRRPTRRTDNYIIGVSAKLSDLAHFVQSEMRPFIEPCQLPARMHDLSPKMHEMIIARAQRDVLLLVVQLMRHHEIWYDEATGAWQICQSTMDEFLLYRSTARRNKVDDRSFHGRVRSQSNARGIPEGVSVGLA